MSRKEHLTRQKQLLNKTLGLEGGIGLASVGGEELFKEEDLILESSSVHDSVPQVFNVYACCYHLLDIYQTLLAVGVTYSPVRYCIFCFRCFVIC